MLIVAAGGFAGFVLAAFLGRYLQSLVHGAAGTTIGGSAVAGLFTAITAAIAIWSATRHIARLDIADVLRAELAE